MPFPSLTSTLRLLCRGASFALMLSAATKSSFAQGGPAANDRFQWDAAVTRTGPEEGRFSFHGKPGFLYRLEYAATGLRSPDLANNPYITSLTGYEYPFGVLSMQNIRSLGQWGPAQSVDGDDGVIDGHGLLGDSWWGQVSLVFSPNAEGRYPNYAGLVITQGDNISPLPFLVPAYDFYGPAGELIYTLSLQANAFGSDGVQGIDTLADRFVGLYSSEGISRMTARPTFAVQIDHVQYGWSIPEPGTCTLAGLATALLLRRRRPAP